MPHLKSGPEVLQDEVGSADRGEIRSRLLEHFHVVRAQTELLCQSLAIEDFVVQSMPDVSPTKWHLAHTSWFFETFVLGQIIQGYLSPNPLFDYLFNSYYTLIGDRWARAERGLLSRPTVQEIFEYRAYVDRAMESAIVEADDSVLNEFEPIIVLGLNHEQQHQELLLTDIKHVLSQNPLHPQFATPIHRPVVSGLTAHDSWIPFDEGLYEVGFRGPGFAFDNEGPRHRVYLDQFALRRGLVSNGEYMSFMSDGGYRRPDLWLSDGWNEVLAEGWSAPLYWKRVGEEWWQMTLTGFRRVDPVEPVTHISYYEASAFAEWYGARLPREEEWEIASNSEAIEGRFLEAARFHPAEAEEIVSGKMSQMFGEVWQWTMSSYSPYPGYAAAEGAIGEYNGKFMSNQFVLRGGSCLTPRSHIRRTYRNFFPPAARWQFSGLRLANAGKQ